jgi:hypothetical protein
METIPNGNQPVGAMRGNPLHRKTKEIEERITHTSCGFDCRDIDVGQAPGFRKLEKE